MSAETEKIVQDVHNVKNTFNEDGDISKPATRYLTFQERVDREQELKQIEEVLAQPGWVIARLNMTADRMGNLKRRQKLLKKELANYSPPTDLSGATKDELYRLEKDYAEKIREGMLPREVMRKNPVGAVDANMKWQSAKKQAILVWKNIRRALNPTSEDKDLANVEHLRPEMYRPGEAAGFMGDAQISGHFAMSQQAKENWPLGEPKIDTPLKQAERREQEEEIQEEQIRILKARIAALETEKVELAKKAATEQERIELKKQAARLRAKKQAEEKRAWWAAKKAAAQPTKPPDPLPPENE